MPRYAKLAPHLPGAVHPLSALADAFKNVRGQVVVLDVVEPAVAQRLGTLRSGGLVGIEGVVVERKGIVITYVCSHEPCLH